MKKVFGFIADKPELVLKLSILAVLIVICIQLFETNETLNRIRYTIPGRTVINEPVEVIVTGVGRGFEVPVEVQNRNVDVKIVNTWDFQ